jgi:serine/threonine protein kinase
MSRPSSGSSEHRSALPEGTRLHNYVLEQVLGAGGFGITYRAREEITERAVAIKEYLPSSLAVRERDGMTVQPVSETTRSDYEWGLTRFRQEAKLLLSLRHNNIVPSLNYFEANGTAYLVMEYQEGQTLSQVTAGATALEESEVREFLEPLLDGVEAVHKAGLLHRDIKPDNIFIRNDGTPVLIDFGSARQALGHHSQSLTAVVTDGYAPFEQYERGGDQGPWTDIYAIGAVLFRSLVGHRPPTSTKRLSAQYRGAPDPAAQGFATLRQRVSKQLARAIEGALMVNAEDRPQSIADFRALLADSGARATIRRPDAASPTLVAGTRAQASYRTGESHLTIGVSQAPQRRRSIPVYAALAVLLLGGGAAAAYFGVGGIDVPGYTLNSPTDAAKRADAERRKAEEEAKRKAADEVRRADAERRKAEEEEAKRRAEDEKRRADEDAKRRADEDAKRRADEDTKRRADEEAKRRADADAKRRADEEAKRRADADAKRRADDEAKRRADADAKRRADEEAKRRADADAKRRADEEAQRRADEDAKRRAEDEAKRADAERRKAEEERLKAGATARPSWYVADRNRGALFFAHKSALIEPSALAALERLIADARASATYRITLIAAAARSEGVGAEASRLRAARLEAIRLWLVSRGVPSERIRVIQHGGQGEGPEQRYVAVSLEASPIATDRPGTDRPGADRPGIDRPGTDRPGADRPGTSEPERRYSQAELTLMLYRLLKGAAMSTNIKMEGEQALSSGSDVSALAVCVNWSATTPEKASINGAYMWSARSGALLQERALQGCRAMSRPNCECVVIDIGGSNALRLPPAFAQKYARQ